MGVGCFPHACQLWRVGEKSAGGSSGAAAPAWPGATAHQAHQALTAWELPEGSHCVAVGRF